MPTPCAGGRALSVLDQVGKFKTGPVTYKIHSWSSYSPPSYHPNNILVDNPEDQSSRWSSGNESPDQFLILELDATALLSGITFGKHHRPHMFNLRQFKVFASLDGQHWAEMLHTGLRNDAEPETFSLLHIAQPVAQPVRFLKIAPWLSWGANFSFSVWYVALRGTTDPAIVQRVVAQYHSYHEREAVRLCLKHFRRRGDTDLVRLISERTHVALDDPFLADLRAQLVVHGDFGAVESLLEHALAQGYFAEYLSAASYEPHWQQILPDDPRMATPPPRGGHQLCVDSDAGQVYLLGGWNGRKELADFWVYTEATNTWHCLSENTAADGGPSGRSCHKVVFEPRRRHIYVMGRYIEPDARRTESLDCDFWRYDIAAARWKCISPNTASSGGPELLFDHQMVVDVEKDTIYVYGGRLIQTTGNIYSGMYTFHIPTGTWRRIKLSGLKSRIGHSMLLNPIKREIYIFAGQHYKDQLSDLHVFDIDTEQVMELTRSYSQPEGPEPGFTQRASLDAEKGELYVLSVVMKDTVTHSELSGNNLWLCRLATGQWSRIEPAPALDPSVARLQGQGGAADPAAPNAPCPRFAHHLIYDPRTRTQYLFGGNPGKTGRPILRLDDFWRLRLERPAASHVLARAVFRVRRQRFREMARNAAAAAATAAAAGEGVADAPSAEAVEAAAARLQALTYLQNEVRLALDPTDAPAQRIFRHLATELFLPPASPAASAASAVTSSDSATAAAAAASGGGDPEAMDVEPAHDRKAAAAPADAGASLTQQERLALYNELLRFFPVAMREPDAHLTDLV